MGPPRIAGPLARLTAIVGGLCVMCSLWGSARAAERYPAEAVKAAYLYRFAGYVKWPGARRPDAPFTIDVIGDAGVARELERLRPDRPINGHPSQVRIIRRIAELGDAQMLYIGAGFTGDIRAAIASVESRPVLVVTDEDRGLDDGGTINLIERDRRIRFEVSLAAASKAGLTISSELLSVAARVQRNPLQSTIDCARADLAGERRLRCPLRMAVR